MGTGDLESKPLDKFFLRKTNGMDQKRQSKLPSLVQKPMIPKSAPLTAVPLRTTVKREVAIPSHPLPLSAVPSPSPQKEPLAKHALLLRGSEPLTISRQDPPPVPPVNTHGFVPSASLQSAIRSKLSANGATLPNGARPVPLSGGNWRAPQTQSRPDSFIDFKQRNPINNARSNATPIQPKHGMSGLQLPQPSCPNFPSHFSQSKTARPSHPVNDTAGRVAMNSVPNSTTQPLQDVNFNNFRQAQLTPTLGHPPKPQRAYALTPLVPSMRNDENTNPVPSVLPRPSDVAIGHATFVDMNGNSKLPESCICDFCFR